MLGPSLISVEFRLAQPHLFLLNGSRYARDSILKGAIVLQVSRAIKTPKIRLKLKGKFDIRWDKQIGETKQSRTCTRIVLDQAWNVTKSKFFRPETLKPGTHLVPFEFALCNGLPETVHILDGNHVSYELRADIRLANRRTVAIAQPIFLFRTPRPINLEIMTPQTVNKEWPGKLQYSITIPGNRIPFGSMLPIDFEFLPLMNGLRLQSIASMVIETYNVDNTRIINSLPTSRDISEMSNVSRTVCEDTYVADDRLHRPEDEEELWRTTQYLALPSCLDGCTPDTDSQIILVRHTLHITIRLVNPDEHVSQIIATLPFRIQMSTREQQETWDKDISQVYGNFKIPPLYGEHLQDVLVASSNAVPFPIAGCHDPMSTDLINSLCTQNLIMEDVLSHPPPSYQSAVP